MQKSKITSNSLASAAIKGLLHSALAELTKDLHDGREKQELFSDMILRLLGNLLMVPWLLSRSTFAKPLGVKPIMVPLLVCSFFGFLIRTLSLIQSCVGSGLEGRSSTIVAWMVVGDPLVVSD